MFLAFATAQGCDGIHDPGSGKGSVKSFCILKVFFEKAPSDWFNNELNDQ